MSQFTSGFWDIYIGVISVVSIIACAVFLKVQSVRKTGEADTSGHVWDEDLTEYNNPLPRWWAWLFYITIAFSLGYLVLYPGLGSYRGTLGWTQLRQLEEETQAANTRFGPIYEKFAAQDVATLAKSAGGPGNRAEALPQPLRAMPRLRRPRQPRLPESRRQGLAVGRNAGGDQDVDHRGARRRDAAAGRRVGGDEGATDVAHYVSQARRPHARRPARASRGNRSSRPCARPVTVRRASGNPQLGAPNLTDDIWLHGGGQSAIIETILKGRSSQMPAHKDLLSPAKIHLLAAYVHSLSQGGAPPGKCQRPSSDLTIGRRHGSTFPRFDPHKNKRPGGTSRRSSRRGCRCHRDRALRAPTRRSIRAR